MTTGDQTALAQAIEDYQNPDADQGDAKSEATKLRGERNTLLTTITDRRMNLQFTADAEFPHQAPLNAGVRREFSLPANRPFATAT